MDLFEIFFLFFPLSVRYNGKYKMLLTCVVLCLAVSTSALQYGDGVCNRTVIKNETKTVQEVIVRTEIVPCTINSWIDELSCGNRNKTFSRNVTETVSKTIIVSRPVTILLCCEGYILFNDECLLQTTATKATTKTMTLPTTQTQPTTIPSTQKKTTTTNKITTRAIERTQVKTTTQATKTTSETTTQATKTTPETTTQATKITPETTTQATKTTPETTSQSIKTETTTNGVETTAMKTVVLKKRISTETIPDIPTTKDVTTDRGIKPVSDAGSKQIINTTDDIVGTNDSGEDPKKETSSEGHDIKDILLYVLMVCLAISIIITVTFVCRRKSRKNKMSANGVAGFTMNIIAENTTSVRGDHGRNACIELRQNEQNIYTELNYNDENHYDELIGVEDPYDELPDYDDCDASPKLMVFLSETNKEPHV